MPLSAHCADMDVHQLILSRVAPDALAKGLNNVFVNELDEVRERLSEVKSAFFKLKEVERAVAQLQEGKGDRRQSESLMKLVEETKDVDQKLRDYMKQVNAAIRSDKRNGKQRVKVKEASACTSGEDQALDDTEPFESSTEKILRHLKKHMETVNDKELSDKNLSRTANAFQDVVIMIRKRRVGSYDPERVTHAIAELLSACTERSEDMECELSALVSLLKLTQDVEKFLEVVPTSRLVMNRNQIVLDMKLRELKKQLNDQQGLHDVMQCVLAHDALGPRKRIEQLENVTTELDKVFTADPIPPQILYQVEIAVQLVVCWITDLHEDNCMSETLATICNFRDRMICHIDKLPPNRKIRQLVVSMLRIGEILEEAAKMTGIPYLPKQVEASPVVKRAEWIREIPPNEQLAQLDGLLDSLEGVFAHNESSLLLTDCRVIGPLHLAVELLLQQAVQQIKVERYEHFCIIAHEFVNRVPDKTLHSKMASTLCPLILTLKRRRKNLRSSYPSQTSKLEELSDGFSDTLDNLNAWLKDDSLTMKKFDQALYLMERLVSLCGPSCDWNARTDQQVVEAVHALYECVEKLLPHQQEDRKLKVLQLQELIDDADVASSSIDTKEACLTLASPLRKKDKKQKKLKT